MNKIISITDNEIISDPTLNPSNKMKMVIMNHRNSLWKLGNIKDIKISNYYSLIVLEYQGFLNEMQNPKELFDKIEPDFLDYCTCYAFGLMENINLKINNKEVLVCDHHNYALPFILEKSKQLKLNKLQTLIHADAHSDAFKNDKFNSTLYAKKFSKKQANKEKMEYFYSNTRINDWMISPLTQNNHIELNNWRWLNIVEKNKQPTLKATDYKNYLMGTNRFFNLSKFQNLDSAEIFDLDIDILTIPDNNLTEEEKSDILKGTIPNQILSFLRELAKLCNSAKIVTIATSPGFINQERAIIYVKKFLELI